MSDIGTAYVNIVPKAEGIKGMLTKQLGASGDAAGASAGNSIAGKIKGALAAAGIGAVIIGGLKKSLSEGAELEQSIGGIETLFKGSADKVIANAKKSFKTVGMSANEYMQNVTSFSAGLIKSMGGDTDAAVKVADTAMVDMADNANKMGTDMTSIQNAYQGFAKQNYTMLDNLKLGYGGTKSEMERLLADASEISGIEYDISNLSDVYSAIHVIQGELGITGTTAEEAASTLSGSFNSMKAAFSDFMGNLALGQDVAPAMQNLIESIITFVGGNLIPAVINVMQSLPTALNAALQTLGANIDLNAFNTAFTNGINNIVNSLPQLLGGMGQKLNEIAPVLAEEGAFIVMELGRGILLAAPTIVSAAGDLLNAFLKVIVGIPALIIAKGLAVAGSFALGLLKGVNKVLTAAGQWVSGLVGKIKTLPKIVMSWAGNIASSFGSKLQSGFKGVVDKIKNVFTGVKEFFVKPFNAAKDKIKGIIDGIKGFFPLNIGKIFSGMKLPHFNVSGGKPPFGLGGMGTKPSIDVSWYAKGGIMTQPTLFGGGEAGDEAIIPLDPFWRKLDTMSTGNTYNVTMNVSGAENPEEWAERFARKLELKARAY